MTNVSFHPDCHHAPPEDNAACTHPIVIDGHVFLPCSQSLAFTQETTRDDHSAVIAFAVPGGMGVYEAYTPEGARALARSLNAMADLVEEKIATQATAAIEAARKSGGAA